MFNTKEELEIKAEDHRDRELIISNSQKVRDCIYTLKKEYGY